MNSLVRILFFLSSLTLFAVTSFAQRIMETLDRGLVAIRTSDDKVYVGWRLFANDPDNVGFNIYRVSGTRVTKLNSKPIIASTNFIDEHADLSKENSYFVKPVLNGKELSQSNAFELASNAPAQQYLSIPLQIPAGGEVMGSKYTYSANDASVADLDGDGEYEIVLKWDPSNARNPPQTGFTGNTILDAYKLNGKLLWRIDLGKNIRSGAAYAQFMVYDYDGDGKAEMMCKTADGTIDGRRKIIGDSSKDWRTYGEALSW